MGNVIEFEIVLKVKKDKRKESQHERFVRSFSISTNGSSIFDRSQAYECPTNLVERQNLLQIKPRGINERLTVEMEIICDCPCERKENIEVFILIYMCIYIYLSYVD